MTTQELTAALDFYGITEESYRASLAEALDRLGRQGDGSLVSLLAKWNKI